VADGRVRIYEFALGVEAARWLTLTDADDAEYTTLFRTDELLSADALAWRLAAGVTVRN
jgi:hypothetical protein